jgi:hypothetical protein
MRPFFKPGFLPMCRRVLFCCIPVLAGLQLVADPAASAQPVEDPFFAPTALASDDSASSATPDSTVSEVTIPASYFGLTVLLSTREAQVTSSTARSWDAYPGLSWTDSNPSRGVYNFSGLDKFIAQNEPNSTNKLKVARDMIYTLGRTPQWASSNPYVSADYGKGQCAPPSSLSYWDDYVTAVAKHAAGRIKYWELWNEPQNPSYYCGDMSTMVTMAQHARSIIKSIDPSAVIISPGTASGSEGPAWLATFLEDGGAAAVDAIGFHGYWNSTAEGIVTAIKDYKAVMADHGVSSKQLWDTEADGKVVTSTTTEAAFLAKYFLLHWSEGVPRFLWYAYDAAADWGQMFSSSTGLNVAGTAYAQTYNWMVGATMSTPCSGNSAGTWTCGLTRSKYTAEAIWNSTKSLNVSVPSEFIDYRDLYGNTHKIVDHEVPVGNMPILLESSTTP